MEILLAEEQLSIRATTPEPVPRAQEAGLLSQGGTSTEARVP